MKRIPFLAGGYFINFHNFITYNSFNRLKCMHSLDYAAVVIVHTVTDGGGGDRSAPGCRSAAPGPVLADFLFTSGARVNY